MFMAAQELLLLTKWSLITDKKWKALKCKPSAHYACAVPLIDGLGYEYAFTRGLPLVGRRESDTG